MLTTFKKMIIALANSSGDVCDFGRDNGGGEKER